MPWTLSEDLEEFAATAGPFLRARPVQNTLPLTIAETLLVTGLQTFGNQQPVFGWWRRTGGPVEAACLQTPPFPLVLSAGPAGAFGELAAVLAGMGRTLPGVNAAGPEAAQFAAGWQRRAGVAAAVHQRHRLYRLRALLPPEPAPAGRGRAATDADRSLVAAWLTEFHTEAGSLAERDREEQGTAAARMIGRGTLVIWQDDDTPVSMAAASRQVAGMARVGPVYTPPALRRRGYAGGATAAVTQAALDAGAGEVLLFTDLANPVSNSLYQRLGYQPVEDHVLMAFG
ncbi:MAG TPA: GNAT family N-acetyltransferase [Streptosporangiaceae bacterium]|jgi:RimJ/RimL family protein N-acetyltransferase